MEVYNILIDPVFVQATLRTLSPRTRSEILPELETFEKVAIETVAPHVQNTSDPWTVGITLIREAATHFVQLKRVLSAVHLSSPTAREETCQFCFGGAAATHAMPCCGHNIHKSCYVRWGLTEPTTCPFCSHIFQHGDDDTDDE